MRVPYTYYEDEVRDGFYVSGMMKRAWAASIEVLEAVMRICEKHHIQYFADAGTLLGAIRHHGFIPWDDDLDICMKREEYNRFIRIAQEELPEGYSLLNIHTEPEYGEMLSRVVNKKQICFDKEHLDKFHGFPFVVGIDIFPLDYIAPDEEQEEIRCNLIKIVAGVIEGIDAIDDPVEAESLIRQIEEICKVKIDRKGNIKNQLYLLIERLYSMYSEQEASELALMPVWILHGGNKFKKEYYRDTLKVAFENIEIVVPAMYDAVLSEKYGDYMKLVHNWDYHDYPFYKRQMKTLEEKTGFQYPKYVFSMEDLQKKGHVEKKNVKKRAEKIVDLLNQAHDSVRKAVEEKNIWNALEILEECQNGAISLGTMIEQSEGEGFVTVGMLEEYCELIYRMHEELAKGNKENVNQYEQDLQSLMKRIENSIRNDIKVRKEVVFLPYKAFMWDSLESVWKAAAEDPDCDAYVIPIPYYDKNPDGSVREMHYEGNQYPKDVPVVWYEDYDFAERKPDMIFIHNPYDEYNQTTSVHPFFYAKNLKQFTDELVYIPYFVLDEISTEDKRAVASMENFVTVPGLVHADKVIVQSENMRQAYIDVLTKFAGEQTKQIWEQKILGLGSPKLDQVRTTGKEDLDIPKEWLRIIRKEDGSHKKIILYNTGVSALLQHGDKMLNKMQEVFYTFKENRAEVALLWRPHPLIKATSEGMRPELWEKYRVLVEQYREEGWGIYDNTADLKRAIALCDAYYGDRGSVVQMCREAGKPVMLQNIDIIEV